MQILLSGYRNTSNKRAIMDKPLNVRLQNFARRKQRRATRYFIPADSMAQSLAFGNAPFLFAPNTAIQR